MHWRSSNFVFVADYLQYFHAVFLIKFLHYASGKKYPMTQDPDVLPWAQAGIEHIFHQLFNVQLFYSMSTAINLYFPYFIMLVIIYKYVFTSNYLHGPIW